MYGYYQFSFKKQRALAKFYFFRIILNSVNSTVLNSLLLIIIIIIIISIYIPHISHGFMAVYNSVRVRSDISI